MLLYSTLPPVEEVEVLRGKLEEKNCALKEEKEVNIEVSKSLKEMSARSKAASREKLSLEMNPKMSHCPKRKPKSHLNDLLIGGVGF